MIQVENLQKSYGNLTVLKGVSLEVRTGEALCLMGASGAGKSTLLHIMGTLDVPDRGRVLIDGTDVFRMGATSLAAFRNRHIGFIFQFHHLLPEFTALENICLPALIAGRTRKEAETEAERLLELFRLSDRARHKPHELSGGEQQRVAVARALVNHPSVVFADEPSGNLDTENARELHQLFLQLRDQLKQTFVIVTHNPQLAEMADRTLFMADGRLSEQPASQAPELP
ncbi:MAG: ABC transporter ATP-binding protein [Bacteroidales bacterium]|nr:ABC transporter ATP-binding protein [Bacteroidales bacterium]